MKLTPEEEVDLDYLQKGGRRTREQALNMIAMGRARVTLARAVVSQIHIDQDLRSALPTWTATITGDGFTPEAVSRLFEAGDAFILAVTVGGGIK